MGSRAEGDHRRRTGTAAGSRDTKHEDDGLRGALSARKRQSSRQARRDRFTSNVALQGSPTAPLRG